MTFQTFYSHVYAYSVTAPDTDQVSLIMWSYTPKVEMDVAVFCCS